MRIPNWLRAGIVTGAFVAMPTFVLALTDWLEGVAAWAAGESVELPDVSTLRAAAVGLTLAAISGGLNAGWRFLQERYGKGVTPVYPTKQ